MFYLSSVIILLLIVGCAYAWLKYLDRTPDIPTLPSPEQVTPEMIEFWGVGYPNYYYIDVQKRFDNFMEYEELGKYEKQKVLKYKDLCHLEHKKCNLLCDRNASPQKVKAVVDVISKLSDDLNIKELQKKNENDTGHYIISLTTKYIEDIKKDPVPKMEDNDWFSGIDFKTEMAYFMGLVDVFDEKKMKGEI